MLITAKRKMLLMTATPSYVQLFRLSFNFLCLLVAVTATEIKVPSHGEEAVSIFCQCPKTLPSSLCQLVEDQCAKTFCAPLCLRLAWRPRLLVDCSRASQWDHCAAFETEVKEAERAVTSQFQARLCADLHFCMDNVGLREWVENRQYGNQYPSLLLFLFGVSLVCTVSADCF